MKINFVDDNTTLFLEEPHDIVMKKLYKISQGVAVKGFYNLHEKFF